MHWSSVAGHKQLTVNDNGRLIKKIRSDRIFPNVLSLNTLGTMLFPIRRNVENSKMITTIESQYRLVSTKLELIFRAAPLE